MCCLYGVYNYSGESYSGFEQLNYSLGIEATERGTDATGVAVLRNDGKINIRKNHVSADKFKVSLPKDLICFTGHTRHSTQGDCRNNYNNHPFFGKCGTTGFALAHNGVIVNDDKLRLQHNLKKTKIKTDSYIAVQLLEKGKMLSFDSVRGMAEEVRGSFSFSIVDVKSRLWLVKGDSPLEIIHFPDKKLYVYASTAEILYKGLVDSFLFRDIKNGNYENVDISSGEIFCFSRDGTIEKDKFFFSGYDESFFNWWEYGITESADEQEQYISYLKLAATQFGYNSDFVGELLKQGFSIYEIEDYIYSENAVL